MKVLFQVNALNGRNNGNVILLGDYSTPLVSQNACARLKWENGDFNVQNA